ncbi:AAA family ATPase [Salmonella enterica subsp. enterica serovar Essen]|nr:AAA family ATPase [Salmonella enterica subsp. enterica serovar Essen]
MLIFIAGAHAVGKSTLCNAVISKENFIHKSASELIAEGKKQNWGIDKQTITPEDNQLVLLEQLAKYKQMEESLLLDGHFVLIDKNKNFIALQEDIFNKMNLDGVILIECDDHVIEQRFSSRGAILKYSPTELRLLERNNAERICKSLDIPLVVLFNPTIDEFKHALKYIKAGV